MGIGVIRKDLNMQKKASLYCRYRGLQKFCGLSATFAYHYFTVRNRAECDFSAHNTAKAYGRI